jgi:hypothetical protein
VLAALGIPELSDLRLDRRFSTGFESTADFGPSYVTPQTASTHHALVRWPRRSGRFAHLGWVTGPTGPGEPDGPNHRAYPTVQLHKMTTGPCETPCMIDLWVWHDVPLRSGEWSSLATLSADASDRWTRVVTVNVSPAGILGVFHVPNQGEGRTVFQTSSVRFPERKWTRVRIYVDFDPEGGAIAVWQGRRLVSAARVAGGNGFLEQAHFGLYAPPAAASGRVANDDLRIGPAVLR